MADLKSKNYDLCMRNMLSRSLGAIYIRKPRGDLVVQQDCSVIFLNTYFRKQIISLEHIFHVYQMHFRSNCKTLIILIYVNQECARARRQNYRGRTAVVFPRASRNAIWRKIAYVLKFTRQTAIPGEPTVATITYS